jgi:hypothetical protein
MHVERYLDRAEAAKHLSDRGLSITKNTLQKMATTGAGPAYQRFGNRAVYTVAALDAWVTAKLRAPRRHTSEAAERNSTGEAA